MIISPPFLPARTDGQSEDAWLDAAMAPTAILVSTRAPEGSFPLSGNLAWHNGIHIQAPAAGTAALPVRAIADGIVRFARAPNKPNTTPTDPQNYNPFDRPGTTEPTPAWTDNGCVIIEHTSSIGAVGATETAVVFYSLYMHLSQLGKNAAGQTWTAGDHIWRKDQIGMPGQIYGDRQQLHFEICFNANQFQALIGRAPNWVALPVAPATMPAPTADGRTDAIFGSLYFYLPATTPTLLGNTAPTNHTRTAAGATTLQTPIWVKMTYERGACTFETFDERGTSIRELPAQADEEYNLYSEANSRHNALPATNQAHSSPSGWYELLRFGRNIGRGPAATDKDPLPASAAHWRRVAGPDGRAVWADLNAAGSFKFSDADFPAVMGWNCFDDDSSPEDQRCDSAHLKEVIRDPNASNANRMQAEQLLARLGNSEVRANLRRSICKFPSEWDKDTIATRYAFVKELESFKQAPDAWAKQEAHLNAISFAGLPPEYLAAKWRMHPREFIGVMRRCGWLSHREMVNCMPRNSPAGAVPLSTARARITSWGVGINKMARKFSLDSAIRMTHLLAQVWAETGYLRLTREAGADGARYAPYIGRGLIQITWQDKYESYNEFARITLNGGANFNLELIATDPYHAGNSSGFYWVSKDFLEPRDVSLINLSRFADRGNGTDTIGKLCLWINGGGNHYDHRHIHFIFIDRVLNDLPLDPAASTSILEQRTFRKMEFIRETRIIKGHPVRKIVGTQQSAVPMSITIDHTPQR
jgi:predicted chitinase